MLTVDRQSGLYLLMTALSAYICLSVWFSLSPSLPLPLHLHLHLHLPLPLPPPPSLSLSISLSISLSLTHTNTHFVHYQCLCWDISDAHLGLENS